MNHEQSNIDRHSRFNSPIKNNSMYLNGSIRRPVISQARVSYRQDAISRAAYNSWSESPSRATNYLRQSASGSASAARPSSLWSRNISATPKRSNSTMNLASPFNYTRTRRNLARIDTRTLFDVQSSGLASRVVKYTDESNNKLQRSMSLNNLYNKPGQFPIVHLKQNELPYKATTPTMSMTRIKPPDRSVYAGTTLSALLRSNSTMGVPQCEDTLSCENRPIIHPTPPENEPTRSVLEVLKEISRKRIISNDLDNSEHGMNKRSCNRYEDCTDEQYGEPTLHMSNGLTSYKRPRAEFMQMQQQHTTSAQKRKEAISPEHQAKRRLCSFNNDITSSLSSSRLYASHKRKLQQIQSKLSTTDINSSPESESLRQAAKVQRKQIDSSVQQVNKALSCMTPLTPLPVTPCLQNNNYDKDVVNKAVTAQGAATEPSLSKDNKERPTSTNKPKLTLFNKNYETSEIEYSDNTKSNEYCGISFVKPKRQDPILNRKSKCLERTEKTKLALMLSSLRGEIYDGSGLSDDEIDSSGPNATDTVMTSSATSSQQSLTTTTIVTTTAHTTITQILSNDQSSVNLLTSPSNMTKSIAENIATGLTSVGDQTVSKATTNGNSQNSLESNFSISKPTSESVKSASESTPAAPAQMKTKDLTVSVNSSPSINATISNTDPILRIQATTTATPALKFTFGAPTTLTVTTSLQTLNKSVSTITSPLTTTSFSFNAPKTTNLADTPSTSVAPVVSSTAAPAIATTTTAATAIPMFKFDGTTKAVGSGGIGTQNIPATTASMNSAFGATPAGGFSFGQLTPTTTTVNGTTLSENTSLLFGTVTPKTTAAATPLLFGNVTTPATTTSTLFGVTPITTAVVTPSLFGSVTTTPTKASAAATPTLFGSPTTKPAAAATTPTLFGTPTTKTASETPLLFGTPTTTSTGAATTAPATPLFGIASTTTTAGNLSGIFGGASTTTTTTAAAGATTVFGQPTATVTTTPSIFGGFQKSLNAASGVEQPAFGAGLFKSTTEAAKPFAFGAGSTTAVTAPASATTNTFGFGANGGSQATNTSVASATSGASTTNQGTLFGSTFKSSQPSTNLFNFGNTGNNAIGQSLFSNNSGGVNAGSGSGIASSSSSAPATNANSKTTAPSPNIFAFGQNSGGQKPLFSFGGVNNGNAGATVTTTAAAVTTNPTSTFTFGGNNAADATKTNNSNPNTFLPATNSVSGGNIFTFNSNNNNNNNNNNNSGGVTNAAPSNNQSIFGNATSSSSNNVNSSTSFMFGGTATAGSQPDKSVNAGAFTFSSSTAQQKPMASIFGGGSAAASTKQSASAQSAGFSFAGIANNTTNNGDNSFGGLAATAQNQAFTFGGNSGAVNTPPANNGGNLFGGTNSVGGLNAKPSAGGFSFNSNKPTNANTNTSSPFAFGGGTPQPAPSNATPNSVKPFSFGGTATPSNNNNNNNAGVPTFSSSFNSANNQFHFTSPNISGPVAPSAPGQVKGRSIFASPLPAPGDRPIKRAMRRLQK